MTSRRRFHRSLWTGLTVLALAGCLSNPPKPSNVKLTLRATADVNPDANGRPSPVVVRIYQLKADAAFAGAEFFALYDDEQKALGPDLVKRDEFTLGPGESSPAPVQVSPDARFIGVIAAYRDYRNAQWRVVTKAPLRNNTTVSVGRLKLELVSK
jgi:type VI secretion system protein VasD